MHMQDLQRSDWWTVEAPSTHCHDLLTRADKKGTVIDENPIINVDEQNTDQRENRRRTLLSKALRCCMPSSCLYGLCGILTASLILAVIITLWLTSSQITTAMSTTVLISTTSTTTTTTTTYPVCGSTCVNQSWVYANNTLARWQFDNNLVDDITHFVASPAKSPTYVSGYVNQAVFFDASVGQYLTSSSIDLSNINFTIDGWVYPTGFPNAKDHSIIGICPTTIAYECLHMTIRVDNGNYYLYLSLFGDHCEGNANVPLNEWTHVAFVFDSNSFMLRIYINGRLDASATTAGSFKGGPNNVLIGNIPNLFPLSGSNYFQGQIDGLAISSRIKSDCEILEEATLSVYFSFNSGLSFIDSGPNSLSANGQAVSFVSTGRSFQAISFNGSISSYFQISGVTSLGITNRSFSISLWIRPRSLSGVLVHVSAGSNGLGWCMPFLGFSSNGSIVAQMRNGFVRSVVGPLVSLAPVWTHIVQTWSPANGLRLYVNNILVTSITTMAASYTASSVPNYVTLANGLSASGVCTSGLLGSMTPYDGDIDEFRIYSRELTTADICTLFTN